MNERKKILFIITKTNWGGAQKYVYDLATNLPKEGFEAVVAGGGDGTLFAKLRTANIRTISVPGLQKDMRIASEWRAFWHIFRLLKEERPDIAHLNSSKAGALGATAAFVFKLLNFFPTWKPRFQVLGNGVSKYTFFYRVLKVPSSKFQVQIIFTAHGWGFYEDRPWLARAAIFFVSWFSSLFQNKIIVLDKADLATAQSFIPRRKLALIPHGIGAIDFLARADARAVLAQKIGRKIADNAILIGAIAELTKNKGLMYLLEAIRILNLQPTTYNLQTIIIGGGEEKESIKKQIEALGLNDAVFLMGFIPDASRYLTALDIFVLPSLKEGLPYAVMEAMAAGLPVVATRVGGVPDIITDGQDGLLVEPKDAKALANTLARLVASPDARSDLSERARQKIATAFSFHAMMQNTISLYASPPPQ